MSDLGKCEKCGAEAIAAVNGRLACKDHIDDVMRAATWPVFEAITSAAQWQTSESDGPH